MAENAEQLRVFRLVEALEIAIEWPLPLDENHSARHLRLLSRQFLPPEYLVQ